ncbi:MAG TPA: efflux transporter outer membrane subunit [Rhodocyclaceae bacterium]|nr:efflux transporter outer membrane subunit [Rhodocyclaceae bacterium]
MLSSIARQSRSALCLLVVVLAGCKAVGPDYKAPELSATDLPSQWTSPTNAARDGAAGGTTPAPAAQWWAELSDPVLNLLVDAAFKSSPTLEVAMAKLGQSRLQSVQSGAASLPTADASGATQRSGTEGSSALGSWLSMNASWELDLFGSVRRGQEGAHAREEAQVATLADARVSLAADVTDAYLNHRTCQSLVTLSDQDLNSRVATGKLTVASVESGFTAPYQGIRSTATIAEAKTRVAATKARCQQLENLLTRLTGITRPELMKTLAVQPVGLDRLPAPRHFSVAIPAEAVMQRPDIRAAERRLAAASADIGLAEANRYPRLALNGTLGYSAVSSDGGGSLSFGTWSFGPSFSLPIFDGGRRKAEVEIARLRYEESLANFKAETRNAIQEVEDGLTRYAAAHDRAENARLAANEYLRFFGSVEERYREGASNLMELEDARRAMLGAQQTLLGVQQELLQAWVALNRATGGAAQYAPAAITPQTSTPATNTPAATAPVK